MSVDAWSPRVGFPFSSLAVCPHSPQAVCQPGHILNDTQLTDEPANMDSAETSFQPLHLGYPHVPSSTSSQSTLPSLTSSSGEWSSSGSSSTSSHGGCEVFKHSTWNGRRAVPRSTVASPTRPQGAQGSVIPPDDGPPFRCSVCDTEYAGEAKPSTFGRKLDLEKHERTSKKHAQAVQRQHGEILQLQMHRCSLCRKTYTREDNLKRHYTKCKLRRAPASS